MKRPAAELRGLALPLLALVLLSAVFFEAPLRRFASASYTCADLTQAGALTRVEARHVAANQLPSDTVVQMQPWLRFNREALRSGELPLWNPYNGCGVPHLANYQSAVFSPFSLPFYVLSFKAALVASAALKLLVCSAFTFLFLRELSLARLPALLGAIAYAFSGYQILLLGYPHSGVAAVLPVLLFFIERAARAVAEAQLRARLARALAGAALAQAAVLVAGHPEAAAFATLLASAYALWRGIELRIAAGRDAEAQRRTRAFGRGALIAALISAGLAAPQLLPFAEYLDESSMGRSRLAMAYPLSPEHWPLLVFPNALGSPVSGWTFAELERTTSYELINSTYVGGVTLVLALIGMALALRERRARFFAAAAAAWFLCAYDVAGLGHVAAAFGVGKFMPLFRGQVVWAFCASALAALALDKLMRGPPPAPRRARGAAPRRRARRALGVLAGGGRIAPSECGRR